jgi:hypothetical protein
MDKREFYDADLVKDIKACVTAASGSLDRVKSCLQARFTANADNHLSAKTRWYAPPPEHQFWSGVREQPFDLDENLQFLRASSTPAPHSRLWLFEFMLQVAFTSSPAFLPAGQSAEDYTDDTPWEFPQLKSYLNDTVARGVADSKSQDILEKMRDFVVLQRLFRVALAERMGPHFPIERLEELARATAPRVASARTPRWNPRPGLQESILARQLSSIEGELAQEGATGSAALTTINRCVARIRAADSPELIPATLWAADCGQRLRTPESASARAQRLVDAADQLMARTKQARDLRRALAVGRDDEQMRRGGTCPAM